MYDRYSKPTQLLMAGNVIDYREEPTLVSFLSIVASTYTLNICPDTYPETN